MEIDVIKKLIINALDARLQAYAPYSEYMVGAALLTSDDVIVKGCNIENASYPATNCAERTAIFKAVSEGYKDFKAIAIVGGNKNEMKDHLSDYACPCGICRQVMREFCDPDTFTIIVAKSVDEYFVCSLAELLPNSFGPDHLKK